MPSSSCLIVSRDVWGIRRSDERQQTKGWTLIFGWVLLLIERVIYYSISSISSNLSTWHHNNHTSSKNSLLSSPSSIVILLDLIIKTIRQLVYKTVQWFMNRHSTHEKQERKKKHTKHKLCRKIQCHRSVRQFCCFCIRIVNWQCMWSISP